MQLLQWIKDEMKLNRPRNPWKSCAKRSYKIVRPAMNRNIIVVIYYKYWALHVNSFYLCRINTNLGYNCGGGISCNACSRFFHRQVVKDHTTTLTNGTLNECLKNKNASKDQCYATAKKDKIQKQCSHCRMNACLAIGMSPVFN